MNVEDKPRTGLRERKKLKTRATIQYHAMRLFHEQGYHETTIEQIAEASEISPSTLFRYFPTKESLVLEDDFDPLLIELFRQQPPGLSPVAAFRRAIKAGAEQMPEEARLAIRQRMELTMSVPELRAASLSQMSDTTELIAALIAERTGRERSDLTVVAYAGALLGTVMSALFYCSVHKNADYIDTIVDVLEQMENGFEL